MRYLTVMDVLDFKNIYQVRCMTTGFTYYVRAKYFAGNYKKWDVIRINLDTNFSNNLIEEFYE